METNNRNGPAGPSARPQGINPYLSDAVTPGGTGNSSRGGLIRPEPEIVSSILHFQHNYFSPSGTLSAIALIISFCFGCYLSTAPSHLSQHRLRVSYSHVVKLQGLVVCLPAKRSGLIRVRIGQVSVSRVLNRAKPALTSPQLLCYILALISRRRWRL